MRALFRYAASPWGFGALCLLLAAAYIITGFWEVTYEGFASLLLGSWPGIFFCLAICLNLTLWSAMVVKVRMRDEPVSAGMIRQMDASEHLPVEGGITDLESASRWIRQTGLRPRSSGEGIEARQGRLGIIPGVVLRAGLALMVLGVLMSHELRETGHGSVALGGDTGEARAATVLGIVVRPISINAGIPAEFISVGKTGFSLERVSVLLNSGGQEFTVTSGYPARAEGLYWRVTHLGYAQPVEWGGKVRTLMLDVLPPGTASAHALIKGGRAYEFRLAPERSVKKGLISGDVFDLASPSYILSPRGRKGEEVRVRSGGTALIDSRNVSFGEPGTYVRLLVVRDPAVPLLRLAFLTAAAGLLLMIARPFWFERRMAAVMHEGRLLMGYSEEFYKKWGIYKFRKWTEPLL